MSSGPLATVLAAVSDGVRSRGELARRTGLRADVVDAAVDHLVRSGRIELAVLRSGCPTGGCGHCPLASGGLPDRMKRCPVPTTG